MSDTARPPRGEAVQGATGGGAGGQSPGPGPGGGRGGHAMGPMGGMGRPAEKPKDFGKTMRRLLAYLKPHRARLVAVVFLAILSMSFNIVSPKIQGVVMDKLKDAFVARMVMGGGAVGAAPTAGSAMAPAAAQGPSGLTEAQMADARRALRETGGKVDYAGIGRILLTLLALYVLASLFMFVTQWVMSTVAQMTVSKLRREAQAKIDRLPLRYLDGRPHGDLLSRVTNDIDTIATTLQQSIVQAITSAIQLIGFVIMMLTISPLLTLIVLATLPLYILATILVAKNSQKHFIAQQREIGALSGHIEEMYSGHAIVRAFGMEGRSREKFDAINGRLRSSATRAQFVSGIMFPLMNFIGNLGYVLISVVGGLWLTKGSLSIGDIVAFIQYSRNFAQPIAQTANIANIIQSTMACAERVFEVLDETEELGDATDAAMPRTMEGHVGIEGLSFRYVADKPLIESLALDARPGHTVAIVGPTGAGKTTLVNLLMRFYEIDAGTISIDGRDIRSMPRRGLRGLFGMVLQDTWLFTGTIRDNIAYGREGATEEEIVAAAKAAHADHFIRSLPAGYDTVLDEEAGNISQGQRQLLTIARAIIANPRILILDEATSSVDTRTELLIQKAMGNLMAGRTSFVIAHRLSTIRDAELILVMNAGSIVEQGTHEELLAKKAFYADLYEAQFSGPVVEA
ncbi:MAG TPA: ABC transporter ATP-binding protein [Rectinemataceae bacterium]|nr:ABC transporter ATP-binding protein [Rectinemataceae bacterium]